MFLPEHYKHELGVGGFERFFFSRKNTNYNSPHPSPPPPLLRRFQELGWALTNHQGRIHEQKLLRRGSSWWDCGLALGNRLHFCSPWGIVCPLEDSLERAKEFYLSALRNKSKTKMEGTKRIWGLRHSSPSLSECGHRNPAAMQTRSSSLLGLSWIKRVQRQEVVVRDRPP